MSADDPCDCVDTRVHFLIGVRMCVHAQRTVSDVGVRTRRPADARCCSRVLRILRGYFW